MNTKVKKFIVSIRGHAKKEKSRNVTEAKHANNDVGRFSISDGTDINEVRIRWAPR